MPEYYGGSWSPATGGAGVNANMQNLGLGAMQGAQQSAGQYDQARDQQMRALGMYQDAAQGQGPSQAQALMQSQGDQNMAQQMQMAAMGRGGNMGGQARSAVAGGLAAQNQTQQNLGAMAAQEQQAGMAGYAGLGSQMAGQAQQGQQMYAGQQMGLMDMQSQYDQHLRQQALASKQARTARNMGWATFGLDAGGSALQAIGLGA